ncbi:hypothetical protein JH06_5523 [Blastocystis sp. subtype 4]|uniref:hypothetical protein n=1 Tax=Blastocystis sp. subtype 4 TaxID=944170 RepID=UPI0007122917|nr:hypothetical protein JH06_5523 [Blastocystis sp. subtype 4]KNB41289.1 hypothetical protein JH06_5523 [Blastocystis sp. subtype 4]|eukprot:XP_014524732.1 hypothetical protein JH06_5523 [Blastocystis sp. subtype 4]
MSITYFPCFAIAESNRVVFTCSSIVSIESLFELCIYNYFSGLNRLSENSKQDTSSSGSLTCIANYQLYHIYAYTASEKHILFITTAITISDSSLIEMLKTLYSTYIDYQLKPSIKSRSPDDFGNPSLFNGISEQLKQYEKSMSF